MSKTQTRQRLPCMAKGSPAIRRGSLRAITTELRPRSTECCSLLPVFFNLSAMPAVGSKDCRGTDSRLYGFHLHLQDLFLNTSSLLLLFVLLILFILLLAALLRILFSALLPGSGDSVPVLLLARLPAV